MTTFFYLIWASLTPFLLASGRALYRWRNFNFRKWAKVAAALLGMRVNVKGTPPQAPFFLVSNHLSYLDVVAFASQVDCIFVAKSEVANWPGLGLLCRSMGTIFVDRNCRHDVLRVNRLIEKALHSGKGVLLFPEGTSTAGVSVLPFHSALFESAVRAGYPVSYATVTYQTSAGQPPAHQCVCWWGEMAFLPHLYRLFQVTAFEATLSFGSHAIRADDRKVLARRLWQAVKGELVSEDNTAQPDTETKLPSYSREGPGGGKWLANVRSSRFERRDHPSPPPDPGGESWVTSSKPCSISKKL